jgi:hypothetical protein
MESDLENSFVINKDQSSRRIVGIYLVEFVDLHVWVNHSNERPFSINFSLSLSILENNF